MNNFEFKNPTKLIFGRGQIVRIADEIPAGSRVLMTYGGGSIFKNGIYDQVKAALKDFQVVEFGGIEANPEYEDWNGVDAEKYAEQTDKLRDKWSKALLQALTAQSIASPSEQLRTGDAMERLLNASQNAAGAMGALQAANQLTALMIAEQQKMQVIMADSMRSQNMYYQMMIDAQNRAREQNERFVGEAQNSKIQGNGQSMGHFQEG